MGHAISALVVVAAVKIVLWLVGACYAVKFRRVLFLLAATIAAISNVIRGILDAGEHVSPILSQGVIYWSTPVVALIVAAFIAARYDAIEVGRGWRL